jgi:hypothetical protein
MRVPAISVKGPARVSLAATALLLIALATVSNRAQQVCQPGTLCTPVVPLELPVEIETELAPGSLKQAPLWHEIAELLEDPSAIACPPGSPECLATMPRRPGFGVAMPPLNVWSPCFNVLTGQPLRLRTSDGEISWDQPGPLFGPDDGDPTTPVTEIIGELVVDEENNLVTANRRPGVTDAELPPDGHIVAVPACNADGEPIDEDGNVIDEFETPISELDFLRPSTDQVGVVAALRPYIGRAAAQVLGKALFWDMQVGSDGVQACASCHFHAGTDDRTRNQLNPNHVGGDLTLQVHAAPNQDLVTGDFPFHRLANPDVPGEPLLNPGNVVRDANDVASSMGVRFRKFGDIPTPGGGIASAAFLQVPGNVRPLMPDCPVPLAAGPQRPGCAVALPPDPTAETDPIALFQGLRRVEPRNTPTIFAAAFNFDNFWDGRARHDFNGGSVFGPVDPQFHVFINNGSAGGAPEGATNGHFRPELIDEDPEVAEQPVRIRFSSLGSLATGPALSNFEMSFDGRNWAKLAKKLLQAGVTPLANQLVDPSDSVLGPFSGQRASVGGPVNRPGTPGLNVSYPALVRLAFRRDLWANTSQHFAGAPAVCTAALNGVLTPAGCDPFDGYVLRGPLPGAPSSSNTNQFTHIEANFSLFFGLSLQIWQELLIPDHTPFDQFMDANPLAANGVGQPGEQGTLPPALVRELVTGSPAGNLVLVPGFGPDELFGFDIFAGANLTAALPVGSARNPTGEGSNPFLRTGRCMICHLGPEQTDHTNNVNAGLLLSGTEFEFPTPPTAPEPTGPFRLVTGIPLAEEVEENAQDGVEVENRNFAVVDDPNTPWDDRVIGVPGAIAFQDNGVYNIGVRPTFEDIMRGGPDPFGWPLSLAAMALKNLGGPDYEPCDDPGDALSGCGLPGFNPALGPGGGLFEETGADQRINPGLEMPPAAPQLPEHLAPWANNLPAGELHPQIDELAFAPNTISHPSLEPLNPGFFEFGEILFGSDFNCGVYDPDQFGAGAPNFGWGPRCPNSQSAIPNNFDPPLNGTRPFSNRIARNGAVKAPQLRNVALTGPYFHTGSYLTLRQVVDFYLRGGDFPVTNAEDRDPNLVNIFLQAFGFGTTIGLPPQFMDGVPDVISQYPALAADQQEAAKVALVKFLIALTDPRVRFERAPFDHPEVFVPLDGLAPDNAPTNGFAGGRAALLADGRFRRIAPVGAAGSATPLQNFLGVSSSDAPVNCATVVSHFCR